MNIFLVFSIIVSAAIRHFQAAVLFLVPAKERGGKGSPSRKAVSSTRPFFVDLQQPFFWKKTAFHFWATYSIFDLRD